MDPDLEVVQIGRQESFKAWAHGYPFRTVRWHFHPEYELHHVVATTGRYFVGDFIGDFEPGNLVLTGPNLPHNWVSDLPPDTEVPLRGRIVQFSEGFIGDAMRLLPELGCCRGARAEPPRRAVPARDRGRVAPLMGETDRGAAASAGIELFMACSARSAARQASGR